MTHRVQVYPHNDLLNLAHYHREVIERKEADGAREAIALDCMSCLIALAFSVEAIVNLIGAKVINPWDERAPYKEKMKVLGEALGFIFAPSQEPYKTLQTLKTIRDQMAHGKPIESTTVLEDRVSFSRVMSCPWDEYLNPTFAKEAYSQVKAFEMQVLDLAKIPLSETLTSATVHS